MWSDERNICCLGAIRSAKLAQQWTLNTANAQLPVHFFGGFLDSALIAIGRLFTVNVNMRWATSKQSGYIRNQQQQVRGGKESTGLSFSSHSRLEHVVKSQSGLWMKTLVACLNSYFLNNWITFASVFISDGIVLSIWTVNGNLPCHCR